MTEAQLLLTFSPYRAEITRNASGCLLFKCISFCLLSQNVKCSSLSFLATFASYHVILLRFCASVPFDIKSTRRTDTNSAERFQRQSLEKQIAHVSQKEKKILFHLYSWCSLSHWAQAVAMRLHLDAISGGILFLQTLCCHFQNLHHYGKQQWPIHSICNLQPENGAVPQH